MLDRYVICRPDAGLNDILTQIEVTHRYAEQAGRVVVVDTAYLYAAFFRDDLSKYFSSQDQRIILSIDSISDKIDTMTAYPRALCGRISSYKPLWSDEVGNWIDEHSRVSLTFDMSRRYEEQVLLHHQCGGNQIALFAFTKLVLSEYIVDRLLERIEALGGPFCAIHIRHSDYRTDYVTGINAIKNDIFFPVFIATDSLECRNYCTTVFGERNVRFFSNLPDDGNPIHLNSHFSTIFERNVESILDLFTLALATRYYKLSLDGTLHGARFSGYSILAENLITYDGVLASALGPSRRAQLILQKAFAWRRSFR